MPEGDTIWRTARTLDRALRGCTVAAARAARPHSVHADPEPAAQAASGDLALHTHMMMSGSWHTYRPGERWRKPQRFAGVVLETAEVVAVCFSAPVAELLTRDQVARHPALAALGPDALDETTDLAEARRRLDALADVAVGEVLLDQRVLAGVGNVYRCETCFIERVDPWLAVAAVPPATRGARIRAARLGSHARLCWWCPGCQGPGPQRRRGSTAARAGTSLPSQVSGGSVDDTDILGRIDALVAEEDRLREDGVEEDERARLQQVEESLDRCWDLLRQRRARREFGDDPELASVRDAQTVERYQQ